jgi:hypothetical protein
MKRISTILLGVVLLSGAVTALAASNRAPSNTYPPLVSWQAPATFTPTLAAGRRALTDISGPVPLVPMVPCRQYDSRSTTPLANNTPRTVVVTGAPCGALASSTAVALNITVFNITGAGSNGVFKIGTSSPPTTAWINYPPTESQRANAGVAAVSGGSIVVQVNQGAGSVDFTVDISGYYPLSNSGNLLNPNEYFEIATSISPPFASINARNNSTVAGAIALQGIAGGATGNTIAVFGTNGSSGTGSLGVSGVATSGIGVLGTSTTNVGTKGLSTSYNGVWAESTTQDGLFAAGGRDGAFISGARIGAFGVTSSTAGTNAGVLGVDGAGGPSTSDFSAGVRGQGRYGVFGLSNTTAGAGVVGTAVSPTVYGVFAKGDIGATGAKPFIEPHPTDATKEIRFVALEGNEAGTYFRGTAKTAGRQAIIEVPEDFRMVTAEEGLTVQLTPVGALAQMAVISQDLRQIVVQSSRDITFHYHVNGFRSAYRNWQVVGENRMYRPSSPDDQMLNSLSEEAKSRLIANGTYNRDGTVNMQTAERLGWAQQWREEAAAQAKAAEQAKAKALASVPESPQQAAARP